MFEISDTVISGLKLIRPTFRPDARGSFAKLVHGPSFAAAGLITSFPEQYISTSHQGVLRGMHFQTPPHQHAKLVYCLSGEVFDVTVDLRRRSPTFRQSFSVRLSGELMSGLYIPSGLAHGFLTLSASASLLYLVETVHAPANDTGVRWDTIDVDWPLSSKPLISPRDAALSTLDDFESPFDN